MSATRWLWVSTLNTSVCPREATKTAISAIQQFEKYRGGGENYPMIQQDDI